eukprot:TRINITY_DN13500_c0_g2_i2.p1 TRINITY_DN13500_c0_g2~~TRINITY_DN13500_c0_g2_i2.p1  ORF type:complete len:569 (-),score=110.75 TRINITY_DN13500_c0_g2_i2:165-1871(-)
MIKARSVQPRQPTAPPPTGLLRAATAVAQRSATQRLQVSATGAAPSSLGPRSFMGASLRARAKRLGVEAPEPAASEPNRRAERGLTPRAPAQPPPAERLIAATASAPWRPRPQPPQQARSLRAESLRAEAPPPPPPPVREVRRPLRAAVPAPPTSRPPQRRAAAHEPPLRSTVSQVFKPAARKRPQAAEEQEVADRWAAPVWLNVAENSQLSESGYAPQGPLVRTSQAVTSTGLLGSAQNILKDLLAVENLDEEVEIHHDGNWETFPEIGEAIKAAVKEEFSICVALCPSSGLWGVGGSGKPKQRENSARLALCAALSLDADPSCLDAWPDFAAFAFDGARSPPAEAEIPARNGTHGMRQHAGEPPVPASRNRKRQRGNAAAVHEEIEASVPEPRAAPAAKQEEVEDSLPRDVPLWLTLPEDMSRPDALENFSSDEALVLCTDGGRRALYSQADEALNYLAGEAKGDIQYFDDASWEKFPQIGSILKTNAPREECLMVGVCPSLDVWAVGVGMKGKNRYLACKAALAATIAILRLEVEGELPDMSEFAEVIELVEEARCIREEGEIVV